jgi:hypothetical protein
MDSLSNDKYKLLNFILLLFVSLSFELPNKYGNYLKYFFPVCIFFLFLYFIFFIKIKIIKNVYFIFLIFTLCFTPLYSFLSSKLNYYFLKEFLLIFLPIVIGFFIAEIAINFKLDLLAIFFYGTIFSYIFESVFNNISFIHESVLSFVFGFLCLYSFSKKKNFYFLFSLLFIVFSNKRITLLSVIITFIIVFCFNNNIKYKKITKVDFIFIILFVLIITYIIGIYSGLLEKLMNAAGINAQGRFGFYNNLDNYFFNSPFIGNGFGFVEQQQNIIFKGGTIWLLHSDILKLNIEIGITGLISWYLLFWVFIKQYKNSKFTTSLLIYIIYSTILFLTDNTLIYITYSIPVFSIILFDFLDNRSLKSLSQIIEL